MSKSKGIKKRAAGENDTGYEFTGTTFIGRDVKEKVYKVEETEKGEKSAPIHPELTKGVEIPLYDGGNPNKREEGS